MKTFYQYIQLDELYGQGSVSHHLFNMPLFGGKDGEIMSFKIPMGDANIKRVMPKEIRGPVFHVTSESNHNNLIKGQNKKSGLSGFRNMKPGNMDRGIASGGGFIYELDANLLGSFETDVRSAVDKTGRRWVTLQSLLDTGFHNTSPFPHINDLHRPLEKNDLGSLPKDLEKYIRKVLGNLDGHTKRGLRADWVDVSRHLEDKHGSSDSSGAKKEMGNIIKGYIDTVNKSYMKNAKKIAAALKKQYANQLEKANWDEMIVNQYKIKRLHVLLSAPQFANGLWSDVTDAMEDAKSKGIEVVEWSGSSGLQKHINSTTTTPVKKIMKTVKKYLSVAVTSKDSEIQRLNANIVEVRNDYPDEMWEAFDTKIKWTKTDDRPASTGGHIKKYRGKIDKQNIEMIYNIAPKAPEVNIVFSVDGSMKTTAKGGQMKIFGAVINHMTSWIGEHPRIDLVNFSAHKDDPDDPDETSRSKLYSKLVKRYASKMGFKVEEIDIDVMVLYILKRK